MGKETGFLEYERQDPGYRPVDDRLKDYRAVEQALPDDASYRQAARCMNCGVPFCHAHGCPLSNVIPEFNDHVYHHRWREALTILLETNPFPEFTGRICPAPCETSCVLAINDDPVTIRYIEKMIAEKGFERGYITASPPPERRSQRVAIIGSGPAGLACAEWLNKRGYNVVVYEKAFKPGGILRYGIPDFKLEKWVVDRRIALMAAEGVIFENQVEVGRDLSHRFLSTRFDAVVLAGGARQARDLAVPGRELGGIEFAMRYLGQQNRRNSGEPVGDERDILAAGKRVVVIGGGDTGSDCVGTALRQGAAGVTQFEILPEPPAGRSPQTPWPEWPLQRRDSSSHREGGTRRWSVQTEAFAGEGGRVTELCCCEVDWVVPEQGDRPAPVKREGTAFSVPADLVLLSMGFVGPGVLPYIEDLGLQLDARGVVRRDEGNMTSHAGVFVAGDMTQGASLVVRAIADGLKAAGGVIKYLSR